MAPSHSSSPPAAATDRAGSRRGVDVAVRFGVIGGSVALVIAAAWLGWMVTSGGADRAAPAATAGTARPPSLIDPDPLVRIAALDGASSSDLLVRASDLDWRVRSAAFTALDRRGRIGALPHRDTPVETRERQLIEWTRLHEPDLLALVCELYAQNDHVALGDPLTGLCVQCHVGAGATLAQAAPPDPTMSMEECAACHPRHEAAWSGNAHANTLSHLRIRRVDPVSREPEWRRFGASDGISCTACHAPVGSHAACAARFATTGCGSCHPRTEREWRRWRAGEQPRRAAWPPGSIEFRRSDPRNCLDCHMPTVDGERDHHLAARRDPAMLRSSVHLSIRERPGPDGSELVVVLVNLAGHGVPTGSTRRALDVRVRIDDGPETLLATLSPETLGGLLAPPGQALAPGEVRQLSIPGRPDRVECRVEYRRNRFSETSGVDVVSTSWRRGGVPTSDLDGRVDSRRRPSRSLRIRP